jgi:putative ABC transport system substrate-binding protein
LSAKQLGLLHELVPNVTTVGLFINPTNLETPRQVINTQEAARTLSMRLQIAEASTPSEIDNAFDVLAARKVEALLLLGDAFFGARVDQIVGLATRHRLPAIYYRGEFPKAGGLVSYGTDVNDAYRQAAIYVARILKGEKPGDLPVLQPTKFEFILNLRTAKTLGVKISDNLLSIADEVIE